MPLVASWTRQAKQSQKQREIEMDIISEFENGDVIARIDGFDMPLHDAAPDLLAALEDAVTALADANYYPSELNRLRAVIAKAKGN